MRIEAKKSLLVETGISLPFDKHGAHPSDLFCGYGAFLKNEVWSLIDQFFTKWEDQEVKGQKKASACIEQSLAKLNMKELIQIKSLVEDMKPSPCKSMQGIKDETIIHSVSVIRSPFIGRDVK